MQRTVSEGGCRAGLTNSADTAKGLGRGRIDNHRLTAPGRASNSTVAAAGEVKTDCCSVAEEAVQSMEEIIQS